LPEIGSDIAVGCGWVLARDEVLEEIKVLSGKK